MSQWQSHAVFAGKAPGLAESPPKAEGGGSSSSSTSSEPVSEDATLKDIDARLENLQAFLKSARG
jgi:hypothetical protein